MVSPIDLSPEPIYDIPRNNQPVKKLTLYQRVSRVFSSLYERISNLFSRKPNQIKILEGKVEQLFGWNANLQGVNQTLYNYICRNVERISALEGKAQSLTDEVHAKKAQINTLEKTVCALREDLSSNAAQIIRPESGFSEISSTGKNSSLFSKAKQLLKN